MQVEHRTVRAAAWLNLLLPGGGLIWTGAWADGLISGVLFAAAANLALLSVLLFPDDFGPFGRALAILLAGICYLGSQIRMARLIRQAETQAAADRRRAALIAACQLMDTGDPASATRILGPLAGEYPEDLLVWFRAAQALTALGDQAGAESAWREVRRLDQHGIYREHTRGTAIRVEFRP